MRERKDNYYALVPIIYNHNINTRKWKNKSLKRIILEVIKLLLIFIIMITTVLIILG